MKIYIKASSDSWQRWLDYLPEDVERRLAACATRQNDLKELVDAKWRVYKEDGKDKEGFTKEDALIEVLELVDENGNDADISVSMYNHLKKDED